MSSGNQMCLSEKQAICCLDHQPWLPSTIMLKRELLNYERLIEKENLPPSLISLCPSRMGSERDCLSSIIRCFCCSCFGQRGELQFEIIAPEPICISNNCFSFFLFPVGREIESKTLVLRSTREDFYARALPQWKNGQFKSIYHLLAAL